MCNKTLQHPYVNYHRCSNFFGAALFEKNILKNRNGRTYITGTGVYKDALLEYQSKKAGSFLLRWLHLSNESIFWHSGRESERSKCSTGNDFGASG